ncbi:MAG: hypothetical protein O7B99_09275 [Planctomycetota bacterium]|nr:hypothetical protein [Planctomycetota bacterium]
MPALGILDELPPGYCVEAARRGVMAVHADYVDALRSVSFGPEGGETLVESELAGRAPLYELTAGDERLLVRRFHHGGLLRWATGKRFADPERPFRELVVSAALAEAGVRTPLVVGARSRRAPIGGWYLELVTRRVDDVLDLGLWLHRLQSIGITAPARGRVLHAVGELVGRLHAVGLLHADLQPKNVLLGADFAHASEPSLWIIDLDRSTLRERLSTAQRRANLRRLFRAAARRAPFLTGSDHRRFLAGYGRGLGERLAWKEEWRAILAEHRRRRSAHSLGWVFERAFAGEPARRS